MTAAAGQFDDETPATPGQLEGMMWTADVVAELFADGTDPAGIRRLVEAIADRSRELLGQHLLKVMDELGSESARAER